MSIHQKIVVNDTVYFIPVTHSVLDMIEPDATDYLLAADVVIQAGIILKNRNHILIGETYE